MTVQDKIERWRKRQDEKRDQASATERALAELICVRAVLGLDEFHDAASAVRILYDKGREEFERVRDLGKLNSTS